MNIIVLDNVFSSPDEISRLAKSHHFYSLDEHPLDANTDITWNGKKSLELKTILSKVLYENIINQIITKLDFEVDIKNTFSVFHSFTEENVSNDSWFHIDNTKMGGVVYLNNVYPSKCDDHGTMILRGDTSYVIPYQYNRLVLYPSNYVHRPMNGFGKTLDESRLTLNFFIR